MSADEKQPMLAGHQNKMYQGGQQGYPPQQGQGYPPPQQGYPPPQQGYPPPQQGYPQGGAGYPPPQQGGGAPPGGAPQGTDQPSYQGDVPNEDVEVNPNAAASGPPPPTAPPVDKMDHVAGYNQMDAPLPPPSYDQAVAQEPTDRASLPQAPSVTDDECREALLSHVAEQCCYGKKAAQELVFTDIQHSAAFHYTLETFTEKRTTKWAHEPYRGQIIDGPSNGPAPAPWSIQINIPGMFKNSKTNLEVPHTASVKPCHDCAGIGRRRCHICLGRGRTRCHHCHGSGHVTVVDHHHHDHHDHHHGHGHHGGHHHHHHHSGHHRECCHICGGSGRIRCHTCHGHGQITCSTCDGAASLKCFIRLTVEWINHLNDSIVERTALPDELIRGVSGQVAFKEEHPRVWPINHFPDQAINTASNELVQRHSSAFPLERIIMQRHQVRIIPVAQAQYKWKDNHHSFFVYGFERKVHAPDYPQQCCWGCSIL